MNKQKTILVVDDEPEILELMKGWLTHLGYDVIIAADGDEAFWKIKSQKPDLVILDAMIPGRTGYQVVEDLKKLADPVKTIPVIIMSGRESMRDDFHEAFDFVLKPFEPKVLIEKIRKALGE